MNDLVFSRFTTEDWQDNDEFAEQFNSQVKRFVSDWIIDWYGDRCPEVAKGCPCCEAWEAFDRMFEGVI